MTEQSGSVGLAALGKAAEMVGLLAVLVTLFLSDTN